MDKVHNYESITGSVSRELTGLKVVSVERWSCKNVAAGSFLTFNSGTIL